MSKIDCLISVVAPILNNADIIGQYMKEICRVLESRYTNYEVILVDDYSDDDTVRLVESLMSQLRCVRLIQLSRRLGEETAIQAGLEAAIGDFVVVMSPDYDPPTEVVKLVDLSRSGYDTVIGVTDKSKSYGFLYRLLRWTFYALSKSILGFNLPQGATGFFVFSRQAVNALTSIRQRHRLFTILISDIGYESTTYEYMRISRSGNHPYPGLSKAILRGMSLILFNSSRPLRLVSALGLVGSMSSLFYAIYVVIVRLLKQNIVEGWAALSVMTSLLFFLLFTILFFLGEYIRRLIVESAEKPLYHVRAEKNSSVMIFDESRKNVLERSVE